MNNQIIDIPYTWHVTVNLEAIMLPPSIQQHWAKSVRRLRKQNAAGLWIREPTENGCLHYHIILRNVLTYAEVITLFTNSICDIDEYAGEGNPRGWHMKAQKIGALWQLAHYVTKARIAGIRNGEMVEDIYEHKRRLFKPHLRLCKHGYFGEFWERSPKELWQTVIDREKRISDGLAHPGIRDLCREVHELLDGRIALHRVERTIGFHAGSDWIGQWLDPQGLIDADLRCSMKYDIERERIIARGRPDKLWLLAAWAENMTHI